MLLFQFSPLPPLILHSSTTEKGKNLFLSSGLTSGMFSPACSSQLSSPSSSQQWSPGAILTLISNNHPQYLQTCFWLFDPTKKGYLNKLFGFNKIAICPLRPINKISLRKFDSNNYHKSIEPK